MSDVAHTASGRPDPGPEGAVLAGLFEQHGRAVYGLCRLLLRDATEAEDAAQQTFLSAYRALVSGVVPRDAGAWLTTIARNECRNRVRIRMREPLMLDAQFIGASEPLEETAERAEQVAVLKAALLDLPEKQREAVLLRDVYGLRYGEIAIAIGATRPAVEALLFRARRRLQGRLRPFRDAAAALLVPTALRDTLAEAIPGFAAGGGGAAGAAVGLTAAKIATATLLVGTAGTTVAVVGTSDRAHQAPRATAAVAAPKRAAPATVTPRRIAIPAVAAANVVVRSSREGPRAHAARAERDEAVEERGHDEADDERTEDNASSSGPGPAIDPAVATRREHEDRANRRKGGDEKAKDEARRERRKDKVRLSASHRDNGGGGGEEADAEAGDTSGSGGEGSGSGGSGSGSGGSGSG